MNKYEQFINLEVNRTKEDGLALSAEAIDRLRLEMFTDALRQALFDAMAANILPRAIKVEGIITVTGVPKNEFKSS